MQVGGNIWLGRGWVTNVVQSLNPTDALPLAQPALDALKPAENGTWHAALQYAGLAGPASTPTIAGNHYEYVSHCNHYQHLYHCNMMSTWVIATTMNTWIMATTLQRGSLQRLCNHCEYKLPTHLSTS